MAGELFLELCINDVEGTNVTHLKQVSLLLSLQDAQLQSQNSEAWYNERLPSPRR